MDLNTPIATFPILIAAKLSRTFHLHISESSSYYSALFDVVIPILNMPTNFKPPENQLGRLNFAQTRREISCVGPCSVTG